MKESTKEAMSSYYALLDKINQKIMELGIKYDDVYITFEGDDIDIEIETRKKIPAELFFKLREELECDKAAWIPVRGRMEHHLTWENVMG